VATVSLVGLALATACGFDSTLRAYLSAQFWLPFSRGPAWFERAGVRRANTPYAGMTKVAGASALEKLRTAYQVISAGKDVPDTTRLKSALTAARADRSLSAKDREEVDLLDAKIEMRFAESQDNPAEDFKVARDKLRAFVQTARTPEFLSEAQGWLAHIDYLSGDMTAAGKFYLDELNRSGSNLSRETLLNSLRMVYGYDGGDELSQHLDRYFDTPEHAAFAIQVTTNPEWDIGDDDQGRMAQARAYAKIRNLLSVHRGLLNSGTRSNALALLEMRTALRMGDPPGALKIAEMIPAGAELRSEPDFYWMLASAHFLSHDFAEAEQPLLGLFSSPRSTRNQRAAAAYALCGVYRKTRNSVEQIRFALWPKTIDATAQDWYDFDALPLADQGIYWRSAWDLNLLLEAEAPDEALEEFLRRYPNTKNKRVVQYALAVRYAREDRYEDAARIYESIHAVRRGPRMRQLAALYQQANRPDLAGEQLFEPKYNLAQFLSDHSNGIYYNDSLWLGLQRYALIGADESRFTRAEREDQISRERKLRDDQEELWRAYLLLNDVVQNSGDRKLRRNAAVLAIRCLERIGTDRFGRSDEIRAAVNRLVEWLRTG
jgi:hypothetical protein